MKEFLSVLGEIENKLNIPQPARSRVLLEIGMDMEDTFNLYLEKGMSRKTAIQKTKEQFNPSDDIIAELSELHQSLYTRLVDKLSGQFQSKIEKTGMVVLIIFIALFSGKIIISNSFFFNASSLTLPVMGIGFLAIVLSLNKAFNLYIKMDHNISRLRNGLPSILFLGGASLLAGVIGFFIETYHFFGEAAFNIDNFLMLFTGYLIRISSMMMISLLLTLLVATIWFILINKVLRIEQSESEMLMIQNFSN